MLSGVVFFAMGSSYWGRCYAVGTCFFGPAALMPLHLGWAPLEFGTAWAATLTFLGLHLRRVGQRVRAEAARRDPVNGECV